MWALFLHPATGFGMEALPWVSFYATPSALLPAHEVVDSTPGKESLEDIRLLYSLSTKHSASTLAGHSQKSLLLSLPPTPDGGSEIFGQRKKQDIEDIIPSVFPKELNSFAIEPGEVQA